MACAVLRWLSAVEQGGGGGPKFQPDWTEINTKCQKQLMSKRNGRKNWAWRYVKIIRMINWGGKNCWRKKKSSKNQSWSFLYFLGLPFIFSIMARNKCFPLCFTRAEFHRISWLRMNASSKYCWLQARKHHIRRNDCSQMLHDNQTAIVNYINSMKKLTFSLRHIINM